MTVTKEEDGMFPIKLKTSYRLYLKRQRNILIEYLDALYAVFPNDRNHGLILDTEMGLREVDMKLEKTKHWEV
jgi:hypothetical protein